MNNLLKEKCFIYFTVGLTMIIPGSGYVMLNKPTRGLFMNLWMFAFGYITYRLTSPDISFIGRLAGGFAIWTISVVEVYRLACKRWQ